MVEASDVPFEKAIASVKAKIYQRKKQDSGRPVLHVVAAASHDNNQNGRSIDHGRITKNKKVVCFVCGRPGHFAKSAGFGIIRHVEGVVMIEVEVDNSSLAIVGAG